jgi:hypothetical protein
MGKLVVSVRRLFETDGDSISADIASSPRFLVTTLSFARERTTVFLITMGSFGLPMLLTLTTLDGTRVFTCISFLPLLILFRNWDYPKKLVESRSTLFLLLAVGLFSPSLSVYVDGLVKAPYEEIYQFFRN